MLITPGNPLDTYSELPHSDLDQNQQPQEKLEQDDITPGIGDSLEMDQ